VKVEAVAGALLEQGALTGEQVHVVIDPPVARHAPRLEMKKAPE